MNSHRPLALALLEWMLAAAVCLSPQNTRLNACVGEGESELNRFRR
jgi:hypothetical protein